MTRYGGDDADAALGAGDAKITRRPGKRPLVDLFQGVMGGDPLQDLFAGDAVALPVILL